MNTATWLCEECGSIRETRPFIHAPICPAIKRGSQQLKFTPAPYLESNGKFYASCGSGYIETSRTEQQ